MLWALLSDSSHHRQPRQEGATEREREMPCPSFQAFQASSGMAMATFSPLSEKCNDHDSVLERGWVWACLQSHAAGKCDGHNYHLLLPLIRHGHGHDFQATLCKATMSLLSFLIRAIADNLRKRGRGREICHVHYSKLCKNALVWP